MKPSNMKAKGLTLTVFSTALVFIALSVMSFSKGGEPSVVRKYYTEAKKNNPAIETLLQDWEKLESEQQELRGKYSAIINQSSDFYRETTEHVRLIKDPELKSMVEKKIAASVAAYNAKADEIKKQNNEIDRMQQERGDHQVAIMLLTSMSEIEKAQQSIKADQVKLSDIAKKHEEIKARAKVLINSSK
jgi:predicted RNase H-like nuclease (RuvC/YqgF family)